MTKEEPKNGRLQAVHRARSHPSRIPTNEASWPSTTSRSASNTPDPVESTQVSMINLASFEPGPSQVGPSEIVQISSSSYSYIKIDALVIQARSVLISNQTCGTLLVPPTR